MEMKMPMKNESERNEQTNGIYSCVCRNIGLLVYTFKHKQNCNQYTYKHSATATSIHINIL